MGVPYLNKAGSPALPARHRRNLDFPARRNEDVPCSIEITGKIAGDRSMNSAAATQNMGSQNKPPGG